MDGGRRGYSGGSLWYKLTYGIEKDTHYIYIYVQYSYIHYCKGGRTASYMYVYAQYHYCKGGRTASYMYVQVQYSYIHYCKGGRTASYMYVHVLYMHSIAISITVRVEWKGLLCACTCMHSIITVRVEGLHSIAISITVSVEWKGLLRACTCMDYVHIALLRYGEVEYCQTWQPCCDLMTGSG